MNLIYSALRTPHSALEGWLPDMDLNHDKQIQSLLCYRYTIGQTGAAKINGGVTESRLVCRIESGGQVKAAEDWPHSDPESFRGCRIFVRSSESRSVLECGQSSAAFGNTQHATRNT